MYNVNYENTFALTVKFNTLWVFLVLVTLKNLKCYQINVNNIFIKSFLKKIIYITALLSVKVALNCILCILCSLYSLKQVIKDWHECCVSELIKQDFHQSNADLCLLIHTDKNIILLLYTNDIMIASSVLLSVL